MQEILSRMSVFDCVDIFVFPDDTILNVPVEEWPICDCLISFYSKGFPLEKAIEYAKLRKPFVLNDLEMQFALMDRFVDLISSIVTSYFQYIQGRDPFNQKFRFEFLKFLYVKRIELVTSKWWVCCVTCLLLKYGFKQTDNFNPAEQQRDNNNLLVSS